MIKYVPNIILEKGNVSNILTKKYFGSRQIDAGCSRYHNSLKYQDNLYRPTQSSYIARLIFSPYTQIKLKKQK
jgi:hypothetical protein